MSNTYLINLDTTRVMAAFNTVEEAQTCGRAGDYNFTIVTDATDVEAQLKRDEMTVLYNQATGADLKKFSNKVEGAARTFEAMEQHHYEPIPAAQEKPAANRKPKKNGAVAQVWELADNLQAKGETTRANLLAAAEAAGINPNTAKTQWQAWRKANLQ